VIVGKRIRPAATRRRRLRAKNEILAKGLHPAAAAAWCVTAFTRAAGTPGDDARQPGKPARLLQMHRETRVQSSNGASFGLTSLALKNPIRKTQDATGAGLAGIRKADMPCTTAARKATSR
jgi:hypothetical protein